MPITSTENKSLLTVLDSSEPHLLQQYLSNTSSVDFTGDENNSIPALHFAVKQQFRAAIPMLLTAGAWLEGRNKLYPHTALIEAYHCNDIETFLLLLQFGADINAVDEHGETVTVKIMKSKNMDWISTLVRIWGDRSVDDQNNTLVHYAVYYGFDAAIPVLKQLGVPINTQNSLGQTPVDLALDNKQGKCFQTLIDTGLNPNEQDDEGRTFLMRAMKHRDFVFLKLIAKKGVSPFIKDKQGNDLENYAKFYNFSSVVPLIEYFAFDLLSLVFQDKLEVFKGFLAAGVNPNEVVDGITVLNVILLYKKIEFLKEILKYNVDVNLKPEKGLDSVATALNANFLEAIPLLIKAGAKTKGLLETWMFEMDIEQLKFLLDVGVIPDSERVGYFSILWDCIYNNKIEMLQELLSRFNFDDKEIIFATNCALDYSKRTALPILTEALARQKIPLPDDVQARISELTKKDTIVLEKAAEPLANSIDREEKERVEERQSHPENLELTFLYKHLASETSMDKPINERPDPEVRYPTSDII